MFMSLKRIPKKHTPFQIPTILDCRGFIFYFYV